MSSLLLIVSSSSVDTEKLKDQNAELEIECSIRSKSRHKLWSWTHMLIRMLENDIFGVEISA